MVTARCSLLSRSSYVNADILGEGGETEGTAGEAEVEVDTSPTLAEMLAQVLTGLLGQGTAMSDLLLACLHLRCLLSSHSHSIRKNMSMMRRVGMRNPIFMHLKRMMRRMVCMVLRLVLLLLGRVLMASMALMVEHLLFLLFMYTGNFSGINTHSTLSQFSMNAPWLC